GTLPERPVEPTCEPSDAHDELRFFAGDQRIQATADHNGCVSLWVPALGSATTRQADAGFWALMDRTLSDDWAVPAQPDQLGVKAVPASGDPNGTASDLTITDAAIMAPLFDALFALPAAPDGWHCTTGAGAQFGLSFSWHEMGLVSAVADQTCG